MTTVLDHDGHRLLNTDLLATKLHRPALPARWVRRPFLCQRLHEGLKLKRRVTLVSAPAGFGKTTCISEWVDDLEGRPVAWLSLDAADDDPGRFFSYLVAALQQVDARLGQKLGGVLRSGQLPPVEVIGATLLNDVHLRVEEPFLLILDDFHVIQERFILDVLATVVTNLPPVLHLVLITREDPPLPLARLRAHNRLTEIRARDLRFGNEDAAAFLNEVMGLSFSPADIDRLQTKTEGWIAGLQLAALSAQERTDATQFIASLSGSHRTILSYLTEQVLDQQPQEIRTFLLQTSILDRLHGDLCNAVTGRSDGQALLERLLRANLFVIPLDDEGRWYRYHHLFADLLRNWHNASQKENMANLHRRASRWYADEESRQPGLQATLAGEAVRHALAAGDVEMAVQLLERHAPAMIMQGYARTVNGWVQAIPDEWAWSGPRTNLAFAWMHLLRGAYAEATPYLARAHSHFAAEGAGSEATKEMPSLKAEWLIMNALLLLREGKTAESVELANRALALAPQTDSRVRSLAHWAVAGVRQSMGAHAEATEHYRRAMQQGRAAENAVAEMMAVSGLAQMALEQGRLHLSFEIATQAVARVERSSVLPPISAVAYGALAQIHYEWDQRDRARRQAQRALELSTLGGYNSGMAFSRIFFSRLQQLEGNLGDAVQEIRSAADLVQGDAPDYIRQEVTAQQVRLYLAQGMLATALMILEAHGFSYQDAFAFPDLPVGPITHSLGLLYNSSLRLLLHQARSGDGAADLVAGIRLADRLIARARRDQFLLVELEALLLRAQVLSAETHAASGHDEQALVASRADYVSTLELGEPPGFIGIFLDQEPPVMEALVDLLKAQQVPDRLAAHARRILDAYERLPAPGAIWPAQPPATSWDSGEIEAEPRDDADSMVEPLTDREREVLALMARGLTYKAIAEELFISLNTVRFHVKAVYGKLNVHKRAQAVQKARQRHIL